MDLLGLRSLLEMYGAGIQWQDVRTLRTYEVGGREGCGRNEELKWQLWRRWSLRWAWICSSWWRDTTAENEIVEFVVAVEGVVFVGKMLYNEIHSFFFLEDQIHLCSPPWDRKHIFTCKNDAQVNDKLKFKLMN